MGCSYHPSKGTAYRRRTSAAYARHTRSACSAVHAVLQPRGASVQPSSAVRHDILALLEMETGTAPLF